MRTVFLAAMGVCALAAPAIAQSQPGATASMIDARGQPVGIARFIQTPRGLLVDVELTSIAAGEHGFHVHEVGQCDAAGGFESAGGHYAGGDHQHGYLAESGAHAGDMPNQFVQSDGALRAHVFNPQLTIEGGDAPLLDANGSTLIVHADPDDYSSQPSGQAGDRLACGVVERR